MPPIPGPLRRPATGTGVQVDAGAATPPLPPACPDVTEDRIAGGRLTLWQPANGHRIALDTLLLAAFAPARPGECVVEAGCGVGAAALALARRVDGVRVTAVEIDAALAGLARCNAARNGLDQRVSIVAGDVLDRALPASAGLADGAFDHVMMNPPWLDAARVTPSPDAARRLAHVEDGGGLRAWTGFAVRLLRHRGTLTLIYRADRLADVLAALDGRFGSVEILPLWPRAGVDARRILVRAAKGAAAPLRLRAGLVLHAPDGSWTAQAGAVLRDLAALP